MSTGADAKTMPVTREYEDGYERVFGKREPVRGKWVWDTAQQKLVPEADYVPPSPASYNVGDGIATGRFYENTSIQVGENEFRDVGSRRKYREYLRETGLTHASDYTESWKKAAERREAVKDGRMPSKSRREVLARKMYELDKP